MKYIYVVLMSLCIILSTFLSPAYGAETNAIIHYSEQFVEIHGEFVLEQGYSIKVIDANPINGNSLLELYLNDEKIDAGMQFARENDPFEYIKTVTDEDDNETDTDYLIIHITPIEVIKEPFSVKYKTEQYIDPQFETEKYLILDKSKSIKINTPFELKEEYELEASDLKDTSVTLTLSKNGHLVKQEEVENGDMFTYSKTVGSKVLTIFIAKLDNIFIGTDSEMVFLKHVSQRADINVESDGTITVEGADSAKIRDGDIAIIRYTFENEDISDVEIRLDGEQIDSRSGVGTGTYSTVTGKLDKGMHEIVMITVTGDGTRSTHAKAFMVESSIASEAIDIASETASKFANDVGEDNETVGKALETIGNAIEAPGFGSILSVIMIGLVCIALQPKKKN
ncbi:MAG TPA: hypothetical protein C5S50_09295 [Methanosarcinaceae archaeon]|nr:hypothetical protein [Methanosarcinaceae archaeon]